MSKEMGPREKALRDMREQRVERSRLQQKEFRDRQLNDLKGKVAAVTAKPRKSKAKK